jgi:hypothetical protein
MEVGEDSHRWGGEHVSKRTIGVRSAGNHAEQLLSSAVKTEARSCFVRSFEAKMDSFV